MKRVAQVSVLLLAVAAVLGTSSIYRNIRLDRGLSALKAERYAAAYEDLQPLAALGDSEAQVVLGLMTAYGWAVARNQEEAVHWFTRSGRPIAAYAYEVGDSYAQGVGSIPKDELLAASWFKIAADAGSKEAADRLAAAPNK